MTGDGRAVGRPPADLVAPVRSPPIFGCIAPLRAFATMLNKQPAFGPADALLFTHTFVDSPEMKIYRPPVN